jgi:hypothetical protein
MTTETASIFELIRREGLIVVALGALVWQVYWITTTASEQDRHWREEMAKYRQQEILDAENRLQASAEIAQVMTKIVARLESIEDALNLGEENAARRD